MLAHAGTHWYFPICWRVTRVAIDPSSYVSTYVPGARQVDRLQRSKLPEYVIQRCCSSQLA